MKLQELYKPKEITKLRNNYYNYKQGNDGNIDPKITVKEILAKFDFSPIGTGAYGTVFKNFDYSYVLKVFFRDSAYLKWLNFCKDNQNNIYIPKLKNSFIRIIPKEEVYAVRMEPLKELHGYTDLKKYNKLSKTIQNGFYAISDKKFNIKNKDLSLVIRFLYKMHIIGDLDLDMHKHNVMKRENGELVITDPIS